MSACLSVRLEKLGCHWADFHETWYLKIFFQTLSRKIQVSWKSDKNEEYSMRRHFFTFMIIPSLILVRMRNVPDKRCRKNQHMYFVYNNIFPEYRAVYETRWKNMVEPDRP